MSNSPVTVAVYTEIHSAHLTKGWLDSASIDSSVINKSVMSVYSDAGPGEYHVVVKECDFEKASEVISTFSKPIDIKSTYQISKIAAVIDFSETALESCKYALNLAVEKGASLVIAYSYLKPLVSDNGVSSSEQTTDAGNVYEKLKAEGELKIEKFADQFKSAVNSSGIDISMISKVELGDINGKAILEYIANNDIDIVIGNHNSVNSNIIHKAEVPVVIIPDSFRSKKAYSNTLYITRNEKANPKSISKLLALTYPQSNSITIGHLNADKGSNPQEIDLMKQQVNTNFKDENIRYSVIDGDIEEYINNNNIDIVAVTSHKRNLISYFLEPSLTDKLLRTLEIPILIFHDDN